MRHHEPNPYEGKSLDELKELMIAALYKKGPYPEYPAYLLGLHNMAFPQPIYTPVVEALEYEQLIEDLNGRVKLTPVGREVAEVGYRKWRRKQSRKASIATLFGRFDAVGSILGGLGTVLGLWAVFGPNKADMLEKKLEQQATIIQRLEFRLVSALLEKQLAEPVVHIYRDRSGWAGVVRYAPGDSLYRWTDDPKDTVEMKRILPTIPHPDKQTR